MSNDTVLLALRKAVEESLSRTDGGQSVSPILVACSGGADSLALLATTVQIAGRPVIGITVDHGLQANSAHHARHVVGQMATLGVTETVSVRVDIQPRGLGLEAAAREARYAVLTEVATRLAADTVLLGHTFDDQAETVLLGLARGSGGRSLAGMRERFEMFRRPLLKITRAQTEAGCRALGIEWWSDPHNEDPRFARSRIRHTVLPILERELGPGVTAALVRTADQMRDDVAALDALAADRMLSHDDGFDVRLLATEHRAIRTRMLRLAALRAGCPAGELFSVHIDALERQVHNRTQLPKTVQLPGRVTALRSGNTLRFSIP